MHKSLVFSVLVLVACQGGEAKPHRAPTPPVASAVAKQVVLEAARPTASATAGSSAAASAAASASAASVQAAPGARQAFGDPIRLQTPTPLARVIAEPKKFAEHTVLVEGVVRRACSRKGCWMELATDEDGASCRVTFKDYGFFVPLDAAGSQALVEAVVKPSTLSVRDVRHHEREGAQFPNKNPDGTAEETRLVANGVQLWR